MFKIDTPQGERFMVQLVGPASYRMGALIAYRGQSLTVSRRTRDYLVRKTGGAWVDFDPTPPDDFEPILPPQFGEQGGPAIDLSDINPETNPAISMEHAMMLAANGGGEVPTNGVDLADLDQAPGGEIDTADQSGDMSGKDLAKAGGQPGAGKKTGPMKITPSSSKPAPAKADSAKGDVIEVS